MRAMIVPEHGGPDVLRLAELPAPEPGPGEVRLRVRATALNHLDLWVRRGLPGLPPSFPHVGGSDIAGEIERLGTGVGGWEVGDAVVANPTLSCGHCHQCVRGEDNLCDDFAILGEHRWGGLADYVVVPAANLVAKPDHLSFEEAAAMPLVYATAWRMLIPQARLKPGETVLVIGAGGGVNSAAIQIARVAGARVWATTSTPEKMERARELGAEWVVNYREENWGKAVWHRSNKRGVDVVVDNVGEATWTQSLRALAKGGRLVTVGATTGPKGETDIRLVFWRHLQIIGSTMANRGEFMDVMRLIAQGDLTPVVDRILPLEETATGHRLLEEGDHFGKIVIRLQ